MWIASVACLHEYIFVVWLFYCLTACAGHALCIVLFFDWRWLARMNWRRMYCLFVGVWQAFLDECLMHIDPEIQVRFGLNCIVFLWSRVDRNVGLASVLKSRVIYCSTDNKYAVNSYILYKFLRSHPHSSNCASVTKLSLNEFRSQLSWLFIILKLPTKFETCMF